MSPSPLAGEGCEGLASESELSRSWMRGPRQRRAARERCLSHSPAKPLAVQFFRRFLFWAEGVAVGVALLRARAPVGAPPLIQLRLSSLSLAKATHPSPARGEGQNQTICTALSNARPTASRRRCTASPNSWRDSSGRCRQILASFLESRVWFNIGSVPPLSE